MNGGEYVNTFNGQVTLDLVIGIPLDLPREEH